MLATSCSQEMLNTGIAPEGTEVTVSLNMKMPQSLQSRSYSDGTTAKHLQYAVYEVAEDGSLTMKGDKIDDTINLNKQIEVRLITGKTYKLVFWAGADFDGGETNPYTVEFTSTGATMTIDYNHLNANDERLDAFTGTDEFKVVGDMEKTIYLYRPFAQINVGTDDWADAAKLGETPDQSMFLVFGTVYNKLDLVTGEVEADENSHGMPNNVSFNWNALPQNEVFPYKAAGKTYTYLGMIYLLMPKEEKQVLDLGFYYGNEESSTNSGLKFVSYVPVQGNWRTNIFGSALTSDIKMDVTIMPDYDGDHQYTNVPGVSDDETGLRYVAAFGGTYVVQNDFELQNPIDFDAAAVVDFNGHTITYNKHMENAFCAFNDLVLKGEGKLITTLPQTEEEYAIPLWVQAPGHTVTIDGPSIVTESTEHAIYVIEGDVIIKSGYFESTVPYKGAYWTLNIEDDNRRNNTASLWITGGVFKNFDPAANVSEGYPTNFVVEGYKSVEVVDGDDKLYYVVPETTTVVSQNLNYIAKGDVLLVDDVTVGYLTGQLGDANIDLNGHTMTVQTNYSSDVRNGYNWEISNGKLVFEGSALTATNFIINSGSTLKLKNVEIQTDGAGLGAQADASELYIENCKITSGSYGISTNASANSAGFVYGEGAKITVVNSEISAYTPVMNNVGNTLTFTGCTLNGTIQAAFIRCGIATFDNCEFNITNTNGNPFRAKAWGQGNNATIAGIVVGNSTAGQYKQKATVTVNGGKVNIDGQYASQTPALHARMVADYPVEVNYSGITVNRSAELESGYFDYEIASDGIKVNGSVANVNVTVE